MATWSMPALLDETSKKTRSPFFRFFRATNTPLVACSLELRGSVMPCLPNTYLVNEEQSKYRVVLVEAPNLYGLPSCCLAVLRIALAFFSDQAASASCGSIRANPANSEKESASTSASLPALRVRLICIPPCAAVVSGLDGLTSQRQYSKYFAAQNFPGSRKTLAGWELQRFYENPMRIPALGRSARQAGGRSAFVSGGRRGAAASGDPARR